jgi:hypothetical protein
VRAVSAQHAARRWHDDRAGLRAPATSGFRKKYARVVDIGDARCAGCGLPIYPDEPWDLGHSDWDRSVYTGPEHRRCNRSTERHGVKRLRRRRFSRRW